ncbi:MAG: Wzz/FepE/Etk N-terminal domain-containing protein, partial [Desulfatiglandaceae bacterium]
MDQGRQIDPDAHRYEYYEDEIELMDLLKVIWKWKYLILAGTLICAVGAALISLQMTRVYRVDTVISPGVVKVEQGGKIIHIGSAQEIKSLIETGALEGRILKRVQVPDPEVLPKSLDFESKIPKGGNELEISYETANTDFGVQVLGELNQLLVEKFKDLATYYREEYDIQIRSKASETSRLDEKMDKAKNEIGRVKAENRSEISELEAKISSKQAEIQANEAEKENKISEIENKIVSKKLEIATNEA